MPTNLSWSRSSNTPRTGTMKPLVKPRFTFHYQKLRSCSVQIQKQQVVSGFGFRLPVQLFSFIHDFRDREDERKERREGKRERERKELVRTNLHSWALEFLGWSTFESLAGCAPYANAFTIELTIGLQARVPTLRETRVSYRY